MGTTLDSLIISRQATFVVRALLWLAPCCAALAQDTRRALTYAAMYESDPRPEFAGEVARVGAWLDDDHYLETIDGAPMRVHAVSGAASPVYDYQAAEKSLIERYELRPADARRIARRGWQWTPDRRIGIALHDHAVYRLDAASGDVRRVRRSDRGFELLRLSPGGRYASFVRGNDLWTLDLRSGGEHRLTRDGSETTLNGKLDWVYQEEIYGRNNFNAAWWRDDERCIAFLQIDQSDVPEFTYVDHTGDRPRPVMMRYPRPGDPNPRVRLGVSAPGALLIRWIDLKPYQDQEFLIVNVGWTPDGKLLFMVQDRAQTWLDLNVVQPSGRRFVTLFRETSPTWVRRPSEPHWLPDGSFLWLSDRDGWRHIYHYDSAGRLINRVTRGAWDVTAILAVDAERRVLFSGERDGELETHAYFVPLTGGDPKRVTTAGYFHRLTANPAGTLLADTYSNVAEPPRTVILREDGAVARELPGRPGAALEEFAWTPSTLHRVTTRDGFEINVRLTRAPDFDPSVPRPLIVRTYAGPASPIVRNRWGGPSQMHDHMLAQELGLQVLAVDPRSASGRGAVSAWQAYERLGELELRDVEDAVHWAIARGGVDHARIGITGHSYGGFMAAYALTHSDLFKIGVAGAPVTDWRLYDSIYTERYMNLLDRNPDGYRQTSPIEAAARLNGRLFLVHGMVDDNVHFQNSVRLLGAFQSAGRMFDLMIYPGDQHGIIRGGDHYRRLQYELWRDRL